LNFSHLAKIESILPRGAFASVIGRSRHRGQQIVKSAGRIEACAAATEISPCPPNAPPRCCENARQTRQTGAPPRRFSVHLSGDPIKFADK
jgi:hypothetical protein